MFKELLPAIENSILEASGVIPVVFEGLELTLERNTPVASSSRHNSHELLCLRSGKCEFTIDGNKFVLENRTTLVIKPNVDHAVRVISDQVDMFVLYFGFSRDIEVPSRALDQINMQNKKLDEEKKLADEYSNGEALSTLVIDNSRYVKPSEQQQNAKPHSGPSVSVPYIMAPTSLESFLKYAGGVTNADSVASHVLADESAEEENAKEALDSSSEKPYIIISGTQKKAIAQVMERIVEESKSQLYSKNLMMQILTVELMVTLSRAIRSEWEESLRVKNGKVRELVIIARDYIDQNFDRGISVADAASYVFLSQGYFTRAFRDELGISPMNYLMRKRITKACELLENKEIKVSGIALSTGFSSPQRFNVAFRKQMGMTPMEYRKLHENK